MSPLTNGQGGGAPIVSVRELPHAPAEVFAAFRDPARLARWWGPHGFTNTFGEFEFRAGGVWRFTMHGPDGSAFPMDHRFIEIVAPERIVFRHVQPGHDFTMAISLAAGPDGGTSMTWGMSLDDPAEADRLRGYLLTANEQNLDRLAALLAAEARDRPP